MTLRIYCFRSHIADRRQCHSQRERCPFSDTVRHCFKTNAMHLRERIRDREPQTQTAVPSRRRAVRLAKTIEHMRQKLGHDTDASVDDREQRLFAVELCDYVHLAVGISK